MYRRFALSATVAAGSITAALHRITRIGVPIAMARDSMQAERNVMPAEEPGLSKSDRWIRTHVRFAPALVFTRFLRRRPPGISHTNLVLTSKSDYII